MNLTTDLESFAVRESFSQDDAPGFHHVSVLLREVTGFLRPAPGKIFVDGTLGGGGHAEALLEMGAQVIGLDQDQEALTHTGKRLSRFGDALHLVKANFREMDAVLAELRVGAVDGILLDVGVSSHQLDEAARGFSFQSDGPLDMRMDRAQGLTAADLVNTSEMGELVRLFREFGEEPNAVRIARKIVARREINAFERTADLAAVVEQVVPRRGKRRHPATQVFQALRIAVNDELGALKDALSKAPSLLAPSGRFGVISFHSLEDRLVKTNFRQRSQEWLDRPEWPGPRPNPECIYQLITRKGVEASPDEAQTNPRARSARLRVVEKIKEP